HLFPSRAQRQLVAAAEVAGANGGEASAALLRLLHRASLPPTSSVHPCSWHNGNHDANEFPKSYS
ncbi:MAG TPA: hypothetical protein PKD54_07755, partial [Pirellulaceae bacterium]|nr:hypothetical protein [Pirellulaceae bacterium]